MLRKSGLVQFWQGGLGMRKFISLVLGLLLVGQMATADPIGGQSDPAFQAALSQWLEADEAAAIPALGRLAQDGNRAAQVLLGLIDTTPRYQGPWIFALPRDQRLALLRTTGGLSGRNWLRVAAKDTPLAAAWLRLWDGNAGVGVMQDFVLLNEEAAARTAAKLLARREAKGFAELAAKPGFPAFAQSLAMREWQATDPAQAQTALTALPPADPGRALLGPYKPNPAALLELAKTDPALHLLEGYLAVMCPNTGGGETQRAQRFAQAFEMIGGWWGLADLGPPAETLIDPDRWTRSRQAMVTFGRLLPEPDPQMATGMDQCLAVLSRLAAEERKGKD